MQLSWGGGKLEVGDNHLVKLSKQELQFKNIQGILNFGRFFNFKVPKTSP